MESLDILRSSLKDSFKAINFCLRKTEDIVEYIQSERILKDEVRDIFGEVSEEIQCRVAKVHLEGDLAFLGADVLRLMREEGFYDLDLFFGRIRKTLFPAEECMLHVKYHGLSQEERSIAGFASVLRTLCGVIGFPIETQKWKFVFGLKKEKLRAAMLVAHISTYTFQELVDHAAEVEINLSVYGENRVEEVNVVEEVEEKLSGLQISKQYYKLAREKGLPKGACFNCYEGFHSCLSCPKKFCKHCKKKNNAVKHWSLKCPHFPKKGLN